VALFQPTRIIVVSFSFFTSAYRSKRIIFIASYHRPPIKLRAGSGPRVHRGSATWGRAGSTDLRARSVSSASVSELGLMGCFGWIPGPEGTEGNSRGRKSPEPFLFRAKVPKGRYHPRRPSVPSALHHQFIHRSGDSRHRLFSFVAPPLGCFPPKRIVSSASVSEL
jgi:hypothetical protein